MFEGVRNIRFPRFNKKNIFKILLPIVLVLVVIFGLQQSSKSESVIQGTNIPISDSKPLATTAVNREFKFPLRDDKGKEV